MSKSPKNISDREKALLDSALHAAIDKFNSRGGVEAFVSEVMTESEKQNIGRRLLIAQLVLRGHTYYEVNELISISPNTFSNSRKWLQDVFPDYKSTLQKKPRKSQRQINNHNPTSFAHMKKKYPMHFLFFNITEKLLSDR